MSEVYVTRMNDQFIIESNPSGCTIRFLTSVPEGYKEVQIDGISKKELVKGIRMYTYDNAVMQEAFSSLNYSDRELVVHGPEMVEMFKDMEKGGKE